MKNFFTLSIALGLAALVSCQKQQTEAEKNAEIERQVQQRLAAEHQADQEKTLAQRESDLDAREKALTDKENQTTPVPSARDREVTESYNSRIRESRESAPSQGYSTFYTKLESYGDWIETGDYGYVFHPREAESSRNWRPYTNGRWVYTDAGWTWISEESFGWATYHYGRWTRLRGIGWVWVPGNEWAPAWVSWRKSNDYVGWAPLPPEARFDQRSGIHNWADSYYDLGPDQYAFVPTREFGSHRIESTVVPSQQNVTIINNTVNVTNITYTNTTIVNEGPSFDEIRSESREPVQRYRLERNVNVDVSAGPPRPEMRGETVVIAAPVIAQPVAHERPPSVKQTVAQVAVDLGWAAIANQEEAKKARQKMKTEATPPPNAPPKKFERVTAAPATQAGATSVTSTATSTAAPSAPSSATASATITPSAAAAATTPRMTPRRAGASGRTPTPFASLTPSPSAAASVAPTASQRRGRLLVPSATPAARTLPTATPGMTASVAPTPQGVRSTLGPQPTPSGTVSEPERKRPSFQSQALKFQPRETKPMASPSPSASATASTGGFTGRGLKVPNKTASPTATVPGSTSSPGPSANAPNASAEKPAKQEKKEEKREEKLEMKRERKDGVASPSPSATP